LIKGYFDWGIVMSRSLKKSVLGAVTLLSVICVGTPGESATVTVVSYSFTASGFTPNAPDDPVLGSFGFTFDDTVLGDFAITFLNLTINGTVYDTSNSSGNFAGTTFSFGGNIGTVNTLVGFTNDWAIAFDYPTLLPSTFNYSTSTDGSTYTTTTISPNPVAEVPIPPALPLFAAGLSAMGFMGWRRKRKTAA
jgi:hypothetical protein